MTRRPLVGHSATLIILLVTLGIVAGTATGAAQDDSKLPDRSTPAPTVTSPHTAQPGPAVTATRTVDPAYIEPAVAGAIAHDLADPNSSYYRPDLRVGPVRCTTHDTRIRCIVEFPGHGSATYVGTVAADGSIALAPQ